MVDRRILDQATRLVYECWPKEIRPYVGDNGAVVFYRPRLEPYYRRRNHFAAQVRKFYAIIKEASDEIEGERLREAPRRRGPVAAPPLTPKIAGLSWPQ